MSFRGFTALHYAVLIGDVDVVKALLEGGADPTIKTAAGYLPLDFAQHYPAIKDMLVKASTEVLSLYFICLLYNTYSIKLCSVYNVTISELGNSGAPGS
jgi:hypothetical protein